MKRDMDLIRDILLEVNNCEAPTLQKIELENYSKDIVDYHINLLMEAGYLTGLDYSGFNTIQWVDIRLTWEGHEFIDDAENEETWNKVKQISKEKVGSVSFAVVTSLLVQIAKQAVGLP